MEKSPDNADFELRSNRKVCAGVAGAPAKPEENFEGFRGKRILLCEDNLLNREIARTVLESRDVTVIAAEDGKTGVEAFAASRPGETDAVLMDTRMPKLTQAFLQAAAKKAYKKAGQRPALMFSWWR